MYVCTNQKAIAFTVGYRYLGGKGDIKVDTPMVEADDEYSTSQVSLLNGGYYDYELIEAGWAVIASYLYTSYDSFEDLDSAVLISYVQ